MNKFSGDNEEIRAVIRSIAGKPGELEEKISKMPKAVPVKPYSRDTNERTTKRRPDPHR